MEVPLWSVKYRPSSWDSFVGQERAIAQLRQYAESGLFASLILYGPSGTGKTVAAELYAREALGDLFESNYKILNVREIFTYSATTAKRKISDLAKLDRKDRTELDEYMSFVYREAKAELKLKGRSKEPNRSEMLQQAIKLFASTMTVSDELVKVLILDEADAMDYNMQQALRRTMELYSDLCRFILITPSLTGWNPAIISRCLMVKFSAISEENLSDMLTRISKNESVNYDETGIQAITKESQGDMRRAIDLLQICASSGNTVFEDIVYEYSESSLSKKVRKMISLALNNDFVKARDRLRLLIAMDGYEPEEVCLEIQRDLLKRPIPVTKLQHLLSRIAEIDYRITQARNPFIHLTALLASIRNIFSEESVIA